MSITYDWNVVQLERKVSDGYVFNVHYEIIAREDNYYVRTFGCINLERPTKSKNFIKYEKLTKDIVIGWIQDKMGQDWVNEQESNLSSQIDAQKTPVDALGIPWAPIPTPINNSDPVGIAST